MKNLAKQLANDLPEAAKVNADDIIITKLDGRFVAFTANSESYTAELTTTGKVKKNSARAYDSYR